MAWVLVAELNLPRCVTAGRDRVAGKDLWTHFFQEVQKSLSSAPRCEGDH